MTAQQSAGGSQNGSLTHDGGGEKATTLPAVCREINTRLTTFLAADPGTERLRRVQEQSRLSLRVIREALQQYSLDELSLSYNGGKDCLVLLILYLSALHERATTSDFVIPQTLHTVYIISRHPFKEVDDFVDESAQAYCLDLARYAKSMKEAFSDYLADHTKVKAIFVGTRRTDPHGADLKHFDHTDRGWPAFMRVHPVIDWHYAEVWAFIRTLNIPYCSLYDLGYTSLGGTTDTYPNPRLKTDDGVASFKPAYELEEDEEERLGRPQ
ncbi:hypothetical protein AMS68_005219 [Peltaster fructicola]|uniref:FAD synthase n=1 Tax=Peltaster fructicola TaxID=286661 RepID=A0A6H0XY56_9PEZI|nr:hypothetical protein AMS68_005219 [Peltaster fructicola]